jgi:hypothetical protein
MIIDGLPPGTTIELEPIQRGFDCGLMGCGVPGGDLGGEVENFDQTIVLRLRGTGDLSGFERVLSLPATTQTQSAPRTPGDPVQAFDSEIFALSGFLPPGDPDFQSLQLVAGRGMALPPSFGHTTLTRLGPPSSDFMVDRFFDVFYQITFQGAPGGALDGLTGTTAGVTRIEARGERNPCRSPDDGTGTPELPPPGCEYESPEADYQIIDGLPPGTVLNLSPRHRAFFCPPAGTCGTPGGGLGGEVESFSTETVLQLSGSGELSDFRRTLRVPTSVVTHSGPRTPADPIQSFPIELINISGSLPPGDPDFASLSILGGAGNGLPSPGHATLHDLGDGNFQVDSFFDIAYQIDFQGAPGSVLEGLSGTTTAKTTIRTLTQEDDPVEPDNGTGTVTLPPENGAYVSPNDRLQVIDGLPPGTTIDVDPKLWAFFCDELDCALPGGNLGGTVENFDATLTLDMTGTFSLAGFGRTIPISVSVETHTGPRQGAAPKAESGKGIPSAQAQTLPTVLHHLQGSMLPGDPDFDQFTITMGDANGLPSPGHTTLTDLGNGTFVVDSFFDITYQIDFVGAPGGQLDGLSGSTQGTARLTAIDEPNAPARNVSIVLDALPPSGTDLTFTGDLGSFVLDDDGSPNPSDRRRFSNG